MTYTSMDANNPLTTVNAYPNRNDVIVTSHVLFHGCNTHTIPNPHNNAKGTWTRKCHATLSNITTQISQHLTFYSSEYCYPEIVRPTKGPKISRTVKRAKSELTRLPSSVGPAKLPQHFTDIWHEAHYHKTNWVVGNQHYFPPFSMLTYDVKVNVRRGQH